MIQLLSTSLRGAALCASATVLLPLSCCTTSTNGNSNSGAPPGNTSAEVTAPPTASGESSGEQKAARREPSLVSLSAGAFVVKKPQEYSQAYSVLELLDERSKTSWSAPRGVLDPQVIVIALPEKTVIESLEFDCSGVSYAGSCAKDVTVEVSDAGENDGFQKVADVSLKEGADGQKFPVSSEEPGRWVRLTLKNNHGSKDFIQLNDFRATGTQLTRTPPPDVSGTYDTSFGYLHLRQQGTSLTGCYYTRGGIFEGGIEGRVIKLTWCDECNTPGRTRGPAVLVFSPDGNRFVGLWWNEGNAGAAGGHWEGTRKSSEVGGCPHWAGGVEEQLAKDLEEFGRARVYGINFDSDSDVIRDESKPTLDKIASMLKAKAGWKLTVEGHTDSTSTPEHNLQLSERRAQAVKNYLQTAGTDPSRLKTAGFGATKPVAGNDSELGRAQNRRVELTKQ
jgi:outer membrane protein OmpA-like peptidoglycan-associated protein